MTLSSLTKKVQESRFLTEAERSYWLGHLPGMTEKQVQELDDILTQAGSFAVDTTDEDFLPILAKANAALA